MPMRKNGKTAAGSQRWKCADCAVTTTVERKDLTRISQWKRFHTYIGGKASQAETDGTLTGRTLRRELSWCWKVPVPRPPATGEIHDQVFLDGTQIAYRWTLLIAANQNSKVVACGSGQQVKTRPHTKR